MNPTDCLTNLYQLVFNSIYEPAIMVDHSGLILSYNHKVSQLPASHKQKLDGYMHQSFENVFPGQQDLIYGINQVLQAELPIFHFRTMIDGHPFLIRVSPLTSENKQVSGALVIYVDKYRQKELGDLYSDGLQEWRMIAEQSKDMIKVTDAHGNVIYASPSHEVVLGYIDESNLFEYIHPEDRSKLEQATREIFQTKDSRQLELRKKKKNGEWIWVESVCSPVLSDDLQVQNLVYITRDITNRKKLEDELHRLAYYDFLTGIYNRRKVVMAMEEKLMHAAKAGTRLAFLIMDLDKFKSINDSYGHDVGDLVLQEFAKRLLHCARETDVVGRFSGDEFALVMDPIENESDICDMIERIHAELLEQCCIPNLALPLQIQTSVGYSIYPDHGETMMKLFKHADLTLYREKGANPAE